MMRERDYWWLVCLLGLPFVAVLASASSTGLHEYGHCVLAWVEGAGGVCEVEFSGPGEGRARVEGFTGSETIPHHWIIYPLEALNFLVYVWAWVAAVELAFKVLWRMG